MIYQKSDVLKDSLALIGEAPSTLCFCPSDHPPNLTPLSSLSSLSPLSPPASISTDDFILRFFPVAAKKLILDADPRSFDFALKIPGSAVADSPDSGHIDLPPDFLRLVAFRMPDWISALHDLSYPNSIRASVGKYFGRMRSPLNPILSLEGEYPGRRLCFYGTTVPDEQPAVATYIPAPHWMPDNSISIPSSVYHEAVLQSAMELKNLLS